MKNIFNGELNIKILKIFKIFLKIKNILNGEY